MPYSIIPPILIVISLCGIILFLMKRSKKIEDFSRKNPDCSNDSGQAANGIAEKTKNTIKRVRIEDIKHSLLVALEKITGKSRLILLKLESRFSNWSRSMRSKRMERLERKRFDEEGLPQNGDKLRENEVLKKLKGISLKKDKNPVINIIREDEEKKIRPTISEKITPAGSIETKNRLENLLIERIAVNPKDIEAYERLGEYYMEIKSYADAKECYKQVIKLDPTNRNVKYRMRRLENLLVKK